MKTKKIPVLQFIISWLLGNKDTLDTIPKSKGIEVREKLLDFHNTWYSANIMCLVVLGKGWYLYI